MPLNQNIFSQKKSDILKIIQNIADQLKNYNLFENAEKLYREALYYRKLYFSPNDIEVENHIENSIEVPKY